MTLYACVPNSFWIKTSIFRPSGLDFSELDEQPASARMTSGSSRLAFMGTSSGRIDPGSQRFPFETQEQVIGRDFGHSVAARHRGAGDMRNNDHVGKREQGIALEGRLRIGHVETGREYVAVRERMIEVGLYMERAPGAVDVDRRPFHFPERRCIEHPLRGLVQIGMH